MKYNKFGKIVHAMHYLIRKITTKSNDKKKNLKLVYLLGWF